MEVPRKKVKYCGENMNLKNLLKKNGLRHIILCSMIIIMTIGCWNKEKDKAAQNPFIIAALLLTGIQSASGKIIFMTNSTYDGNLGGFSGADAKCMSDTNKPAGSSTYKAILTHFNVRQACTTANCTSASDNVDWVLKPNTTYITSAGSTIGTTNAAGIITSAPLNAIASSGTAWTGMESTWANNASCAQWVDNNAGNLQGVGNPTDSSKTWGGVVSNCSNSHSLYCAEQ